MFSVCQTMFLSGLNSIIFLSGCSTSITFTAFAFCDLAANLAFRQLKQQTAAQHVIKQQTTMPTGIPIASPKFTPASI
jgi:hypothetical protein